MKHKGFTVVELMIVIVLIAILASIATISYVGAREGAQDAKIKTAVKMIGDAIASHESYSNSRVDFGSNGVLPTASINELVPKYLKSGYADGLVSKNLTSGGQMILVFDCNSSDGGFVVYSSLNNPKADDTSKFSATRTSCGQGAVTALGSGYNYAQVF